MFAKQATRSGDWKMMRALLWAFAAMAIVFALGAYNKSIGPSERGSFVMNYPASGAECGGPSPRALTGSVVIPLDSAGVVKRFVQPGVIEVASHVVTNVGDTPRRIRFEATGFPADTEWHSRDRAWNPQTKEIERELDPGAIVDLSLLVRMPNPLPAHSVPVSGTIYVVDTRSGERISKLPVRFGQSGFPQTAAGDCCGP